MNFRKDKGKNGRSPGVSEDLNMPEFQFDEAEYACWDFKRTSNLEGTYDFSFKRRWPEGALSDYRVLGRYSNMDSRNSGQPRPNRYNSSVKMVPVDSGPAPWDSNGAVSYLKMPVIGEVAAGQYDVTVAYHEPGYGVDADFVLVNPDDVKVSRNTYALRVRGQSMIENEIDDGDIIIVQAQNWADDGDFVVACLTDSSDPSGFVTLKRYYGKRYSDRVLLQPANYQLGPIHVLPRRGDAQHEDLDGMKIQGRVTAIIKTGWV